MRALILGINGQDGSYLAETLLEEGYEVHGVYRRSSTNSLIRIQGLEGLVTLHQGDLTDTSSLESIYQKVQPHLIYNEADQDDAGWSFQTPSQSMEVTAGAVMNLLEIVRQSGRDVRVFQPVSATMFGDAPAPQTEETPLNPLSPYACAKATAYHICRYYRQVHGMYVSTAIMYNHDSVRRGNGYLLQYLSRSVVRMKNLQQQYLPLAYPEALVDIGHAPEYVWGIKRLMQLPEPGDYVLSSGLTYAVKELAKAALLAADLYPDLITHDTRFKRLDSRGVLIGDSSKARQAFGFCPTQTAHWLVQHLVHTYLRNPPCA